MIDATSDDAADALAWLAAGEQYKSIARAYDMPINVLRYRAGVAQIRRPRAQRRPSGLQAVIWTLRMMGLSCAEIAGWTGHERGHVRVVLCQVRKRFGVDGKRHRAAVTPRQQQAYGFHAAGLNRHQIAGRMGVSVKTVDSMLCKARKGLAAREATA